MNSGQGGQPTKKPRQKKKERGAADGFSNASTNAAAGGDTGELFDVANKALCQSSRQNQSIQLRIFRFSRRSKFDRRLSANELFLLDVVVPTSVLQATVWLHHNRLPFSPKTKCRCRTSSPAAFPRCCRRWSMETSVSLANFVAFFLFREWGPRHSCALSFFGNDV